MTEQEVRRYLRQMKEEDSERAFHSFYNLCYDRLFRIGSMPFLYVNATKVCGVNSLTK